MKVTYILPILAVLTGSSALAQKMEHNAFLAKPVFSRQQLLNQLRANPEVAARYRAHFGQRAQRIDSSFSTLRLAPLSKGGRYLVYNVDPKTKKVRRRMLFMPKGTLAFVDERGRPVLKRSCGNPMVAYLPNPGRTAASFSPVKEEEESVAAVAPQAVVTETAPEEAVAPMPEPMPEPAPVVETPMVQPAPQPVIEPAVVPQPSPIVPASGATGSLLPVLLIGAIAGTIAATADNDNEPVPEPATMTIMAIGAGYGALRRRRKNQD